MTHLENIQESLKAIRARINQIAILRNQAKALREKSFELYQQLVTFSHDLRDLHLLCEGASLALDDLEAQQKGASNV